MRAGHLSCQFGRSWSPASLSSGVSLTSEPDAPLQIHTPFSMTCSSDFWDALAPHHSALENSYLDLPSLRRMQHEIRPPVLVVGAGQGLIVAALQAQSLQCDGVDLSAEMIRYARLRRGL